MILLIFPKNSKKQNVIPPKNFLAEKKIYSIQEYSAKTIIHPKAILQK